MREAVESGRRLRRGEEVDEPNHAPRRARLCAPPLRHGSPPGTVGRAEKPRREVGPRRRRAPGHRWALRLLPLPQWPDHPPAIGLRPHLSGRAPVWRAPSRCRRDAISIGRTVEPRLRGTTRRARRLQPGGPFALGDAASSPHRRDDVSRLQRRRGVPVRRPAFRGPQRIRPAGGAQPFRVRAGLSGLGSADRAGTIRETPHLGDGERSRAAAGGGNGRRPARRPRRGEARRFRAHEVLGGWRALAGARVPPLERGSAGASRGFSVALRHDRRVARPSCSSTTTSCST